MLDKDIVVRIREKSYNEVAELLAMLHTEKELYAAKEIIIARIALQEEKQNDKLSFYCDVTL